MNSSYVILIIILSLQTTILPIECFMPARILDLLVEKLDSLSHMQLGTISPSLSHEDITRRGLIRSVARYLHEQPSGRDTIQIDNMDRYFANINLLYSDFNVGKKSRVLELDFLLKTEILPYVALVDFDPSTKDMPYAHFDAEKLVESNQRVIELTNRIYSSLRGGNFGQARKLTGQVLHTIQDFYSHTNWLEMGNRRINTLIGTLKFDQQARVGGQEVNLCRNNCQLIRVECSRVLKRISGIIGGLIKCPVEYYKCTDNIGMLDKLLSGFATNQRLSDGTRVVNPGGMMKCNHGGILDSNSMNRSALGGINKDAGMYLLSPRAHLHQDAARLAELHTEYFLNSFRSRVGDGVFAEFLKINQKVF